MVSIVAHAPSPAAASTTGPPVTLQFAPKPGRNPRGDVVSDPALAVNERVDAHSIDRPIVVVAGRVVRVCRQASTNQACQGPRSTAPPAHRHISNDRLLIGYARVLEGAPPRR